MTEFKINDHVTVKCWVYETRYSWGHKATVEVDGQELDKEYKIVYLNRTWESYQFQSMLYNVADRGLKSKELTNEQADAIKAYARNRGI